RTRRREAARLRRCRRPARPGDPVFERQQCSSREAAAYWIARSSVQPGDMTALPASQTRDADPLPTPRAKAWTWPPPLPNPCTMMCRLCPRTPVGHVPGLNIKPGDDSEEKRSSGVKRETLVLPRLGEFDFDAKLDLGEQGIELRIAGGVFQARRRIAQPAYGRLVDGACQQSDLEIIEHVERAPAPLHRAPAPLGGILLDALQREQRIDAGGGARCRHPARLLRSCRLVLRQRKAASGSPARGRCRRAQRRAVRSCDAHQKPLPRCGGSFDPYG